MTVARTDTPEGDALPLEGLPAAPPPAVGWPGTRGHAPARSSDPVESSQGPTLGSLSALQFAVLKVLAAYDHEVSDEQLVTVYEDLRRADSDLPRMTASSIRSRRKELADHDLVAQVGHARTAAGNRCRTWQITDNGRRRMGR